MRLLLAIAIHALIDAPVSPFTVTVSILLLIVWPVLLGRPISTPPARIAASPTDTT